MIQHLLIKINKKTLNSVFSVLVFILYNIIVKTINCGTIISIILLEFIYRIIYQRFTLFIPLYLFFFYQLIALEETYHIFMLVFLGKQETITYIDITIINIGFISFIGGVCICYTGMFKKSDIFYVSLAGPIMSLFYLIIMAIIFAIINLFTPLNASLILIVLICSIFTPLTALIPLKVKNYVSDGYRIYHFIYINNISGKQTIDSIIYTIKSMVYTTFIPKGDKNERNTFCSDE